MQPFRPSISAKSGEGAERSTSCRIRYKGLLSASQTRTHVPVGSSLAWLQTRTFVKAASVNIPSTTVWLQETYKVMSKPRIQLNNLHELTFGGRKSPHAHHAAASMPSSALRQIASHARTTYQNQHKQKRPGCHMLTNRNGPQALCSRHQHA
jgi:hypothetical protein